MSDPALGRPPSFPRRWQGAAFALGIVLVTLTVYVGALSGGFVYDDHRLVEQNAFLRDLTHASQALQKDLAGGVGWKIYRPLPAISFMVELALWGSRPMAFHVVGVLWHLLAVGALVWLVRELLVVHGRHHHPGGAWGWLSVPLVGALLFAVHPINSEAVIWICRQADLMAGAAVLAALAAFLRWRRTDRVRWGLATAGLTVVALLCKEIGVVVPPLVFLLALLPVPRALPVSRRRAVAVAVILGLALPLYGLWRIHLFGTATGQPVGFIQNWLVHLEGPTRIWTQLALVGHTLRLLLVPIVLSADYSWRSISPVSGPADPMAWLGLVGILGTIGIGVWGWRRNPPLAFAIALGAVTFLPVSNWIVPIGTVFAERLFYLPTAGFVIVMALALGGLGSGGDRTGGRRLGVVIAVIAIVLLGARTSARTPDWRDDDTLFGAVLDHYPDNVVARVYVAIGARTGGDPMEARSHYLRALEVYPDYHLARVNLALILLETGDAEAAAAEARRVIERDPDPGAAHLTLGRALAVMGDDRGAERKLQRAVADPRTRVDALLLLGEIYLERGDRRRASRVIEQARHLAPGRPEVATLERRLSELP